MEGFPSADTAQNWFLIGGSENDGWMTLEFWRYLDTGDAASDRVISEVCEVIVTYITLGCSYMSENTSH